MIFDVNETLFDPAPVRNSVDEALGTQGAGTPWFLSLPHHSLVTTLTEQHAEFPRISSALLQMVGRKRERTIVEGAARDALADGASYGSPVCRVHLARLRNAGFRLVATSNRIRVRYYLEKPGVQDTGLTAPDLLPVPGKEPSVSHDYEYVVHHGTVSILAGINLHTGHIFASVEFIGLLKK